VCCPFAGGGTLTSGPSETGGEAGATQCDFAVDARRARQLGDNVAIRKLWVVQRILQFQDGCGRHGGGREALLPRGGIRLTQMIR